MIADGRETCPACGKMTLPVIKPAEHADARMCQSPECLAIVDRYGTIEVRFSDHTRPSVANPG